uniref:AIPP2-like SPOC-like domain-containing protein n=1 Tax=Arundo donax TaxID=35708 RepID=A0A0A9DEH7_ARUDO
MSILDNPLVYSMMDMKHPKSSRFRNFRPLEKLERRNPVRSKDHSNATSDHLELSHRGLVCDSNIGCSSSQPNHLKAMVQLVHKSKDTNMYVHSKSKGQSKSYEEDIVVGMYGNEKMDSLKSDKLFTVPKGSNVLMTKEILVPNKDDPAEEKKSKSKVITDKDKDIQGRRSGFHVSCDNHEQEDTRENGASSSSSSLNGNQVIQGRRSGFHVSCDDHEQEDTKENRASNSSSSLNGNQVMQVLRSNLRNNPSTLFGGDLSRHQRGQSDGCDGRTNDGKSKRKRKEPLRDKIPPTRDEIYNKGGVHVNNRTHRHVKKQGRCIEANEHDYVDNGGQNPMVVVEDDIIGLSPQVDIFKGSHAKVMPLISEYDERRCNCCSKPIDKPIWSGIFKIGSKEYISLAGHLSTKSDEKVWKLSSSLMPVVELTKLPKAEVWPKRWEGSTPADDSIGLYFFSQRMSVPNQILPLGGVQAQGRQSCNQHRL